MASDPRQWAGSSSQVTTEARKVTASGPLGRPGGEAALEEHEGGVGGGAERDGEHGADEEGGAEEALDAVENEEAEAALADQRGHGDQPDGADGRRTQTGDDDGDGQRQLDAPEHL